jgi:hypothetical protein
MISAEPIDDEPRAAFFGPDVDGRVVRSWDQIVLPLPFAQGVLVCQSSIRVPRLGRETSLPAIEAAITGAVEQVPRMPRQ